MFFCCPQLQQGHLTITLAESNVESALGVLNVTAKVKHVTSSFCSTEVHHAIMLFLSMFDARTSKPNFKGHLYPLPGLPLLVLRIPLSPLHKPNKSKVKRLERMGKKKLLSPFYGPLFTFEKAWNTYSSPSYARQQRRINNGHPLFSPYHTRAPLSLSGARTFWERKGLKPVNEGVRCVWKVAGKSRPRSIRTKGANDELWPSPQKAYFLIPLFAAIHDRNFSLSTHVQSGQVT